MDAFEAFFVGTLVGGCLGIMVAGLLAAIRQMEERNERSQKNDKQ